MNISVYNTSIKTVRQGDSNWWLNDGYTTAPRAGIEISAACPREYTSIIITAINNGWIKPIAHVHGKTLTMDAMR